MTQVDDLHVALELVQMTVSTATDEALQTSIREMSPTTKVKTWIELWLRRMDCPLVNPPILGDPDLTPTYGAELEALGRRMRCCVGERTLHAVIGRNTYYEWVPSPGAVIELTRLPDQRWITTEVRGFNNSIPDSETAGAIRGRLDHHGIPAMAGAYKETPCSALLSFFTCGTCAGTCLISTSGRPDHEPPE